MRMARASGIGTYLRNVVPRVLRHGNYSATLLGRRDDTPYPADTPPHTMVACSAPIYSIAEQVQLARRIPRDAELFWSPHYNIPLLHRGRLLVTIHDLLHVARPEFVHGSHRRAYARVMFRAVRRRATRVLCDSRFTADELVRHVGIPRGRLAVVHLGVDERWFEPIEAERPHPNPYFVFVGNIKPHKNIMGLCEAFGRIVDRVPHDLVLIGKRDGFIHGDAGVGAYEVSFGGRLRVTGEVTDAELRRWVAHAEALVMPSFYEGFGLPALEAMAAGCPVLASNAASLPEVCGSAAFSFDAGRIDEIAARMLAIAGSAELRDDLRAAGLERARAFTWDRCARETADVLAEAVAA